MAEQQLDRFLSEDKKLAYLADESLKKFDEISSIAESELKEKRTYTPGVLASPNEDAYKNLTRISINRQKNLQSLKTEPVIGRVVIRYQDTNDIEVYYICRGTPPTGAGALVNRNARMGRLAALEVGEIYDMGEETELEQYNKRDIEIIQNITFVPLKTVEGWDSRRTEYKDSADTILTINSLRKIIENSTDLISPEEILEQILLEEEQNTNIIKGLKREIVERFALRDQIFLDEQQDRIFRLPLNYSFFLIGPAGTGKTTTLIRRLGQKLDIENGLRAEELDIIARNFKPIELYKSSWLMFTPTELLKSYLKESFSRENVPAPDANITTWDSYRNDFGRDLRIVKTSGYESGFLYKADAVRLRNDFQDIFELYNEFQKWIITNYLKELLLATEETISQHLFKDTIHIEQLKRLLTNNLFTSYESLGRIFSTIIKFHEQTAEIYERLKAGIVKAVHTDLGNKLKANKNFLNEYAEFIVSLENAISGGSDISEFEDSELIEEEDSPIPADKLRKALAKYQNFMVWLAQKGDTGKEKISDKNAKQLEWLSNRLPSPDVVNAIKINARRLKAISPLYNPINKFFNSISPKYGRFRRKMQIEDRFYHPDAVLRKNICSLEFDLLIFTKLKVATELLRISGTNTIESKLIASLRPIKDRFRAQVLVDEAPDFSSIQLGCMRLLAHPQINSFFACGDFNQRLTKDGTKGLDALQKFWPNEIASQYISIPYRQTNSLYKFSMRVMQIIGESGTAEIHKENPHAIDGFNPTLGEHLEGSQISSWIAKRIIEIEKILNANIPSIAVLVPNEEYVSWITRGIEEELNEQTSVRVQACHEGQTIGDGRAIRVFDIKHIKGLEFEAAFFVSFDKLATLYPEMIGNYLYVGSTRAAQFLGVTCEGEMPQPYKKILHELFTDSWAVNP